MHQYVWMGDEMNLNALLNKHMDDGRTVRVGLIGAGKFGSMILSQLQHVEGVDVTAIADLDIAKAKASCALVGWDTDSCFANDIKAAVTQSKTWLTDDVSALLAIDEIDCVIEATGHPLAGVRHALQAIAHQKHVVMVNVEADVLCGAYIAQKALQAGVIYTMAYGDQPAAMCELVDWVRANGFELVSAGKGMNFAPSYRYSTPDTVWGYFGWSEAEVAAGDFNPKMYNSFTDGTKAAIEMAAVANATGLSCAEEGLGFYPAGLHDLANVFKPAEDGGRLKTAGLVDIAASREPDGREVVNNIQYGMFVTFKAPNAYTRDCFRQYGLLTDASGWYGSMWRPFHLIGLETNTSILSAVLRGEATGVSRYFQADAVATAKRDLKAGEMLDGEGGYCVWAKSVPASLSHTIDALPIGLAHHVKLKHDIAKDQIVGMGDVELVDVDDIIACRQNMPALMMG